MREEFLHYIWQHRLYHPGPHKTKDGQTIEIVHPGTKNTDSGPDFFNAKIKIDGTLWAGNVEIHLNEDDWFRHNHHKDEAYNNVILHVVDNTSGSTSNSREEKIPVLKLPYSAHLPEKYDSLNESKYEIKCSSSVSQIDSLKLNQWINRMLIEKLEQKTNNINLLLQLTKNDWNQVFYIMLSRSFGFGINGQPFEMLARHTPLNIILKHSDNLFQVEALLLGQAGLLHQINHMDEYTSKLSDEYDFLRTKYQLKPINGHLWKFLRLRPSNFPTIRIAQLASLIHKIRGQFHLLQGYKNINKIISLLDIKTSAYWESHYRPSVKSKDKSLKKVGSESRKRIFYNTILPYNFIYATMHDSKNIREEIIEYMFQLPAESNRILQTWQQLGLKIDNEATAQALIFLKNTYCNHKKCLNCHIGHEVLCKN